MAEFDRLWNHDDATASEAAFRALLAEAPSCGRDYHAQLLTQIARTLTKRQRWDEAHAVLDEAESLLSDDTPVARIRYLLERGRALQWSKRVDEARALYVDAWETGRGDPALAVYAVDAAHMLAILEDPGDDALRWSERAIAFIERSNNPSIRGWLGPLYHNTGCTYLARNAFDEALALFEKGLAFRREQGDRGPIDIARWTIARCYRGMGRLDEALAIQRELEAERRADGRADEGYGAEEIGEILLVQGDTAAAQPYLAEAFRLLSQDHWLVAHEPARLARLAELGRVERP